MRDLGFVREGMDPRLPGELGRARQLARDRRAILDQVDDYLLTLKGNQRKVRC